MIDRLTQHRYLVLFFLIICVCWMAIGALYPLANDDFVFYRSVHQHGDIFSFVKEWYYGWSGRIATLALHWVVFQNPLTLALFGALNGAALAGLAWAITALALGRKPEAFGRDLPLFFIVLAAVWFGLPAFGETVYWRTGADAYLWTALLALLFLLPYGWWARQAVAAHRHMLVNGAAAVGMFIFGLFSGLNGEQSGLMLLLSVPYWVVVRLRQPDRPRLPAWAIAGYLGLLIGYVISALAPGNFNRYKQSGAPLTPVRFVGGSVRYGLTVLEQTPWWLFLFALLLHFDRKEKAERSWIGWAWSAFAAGVLMLFLTYYQAPRTTFLPVVMLIVLGASLIGSDRFADWRQRRPARAIVLLLAALLLGAGVLPLRTARQLSGEFREREQAIAIMKSHGETDLVLEPFSAKPIRVLMNPDLTPDRGHSINLGMAQYYGVRSMAGKVTE
jgi:hypothetical protein